MNINIKTGDFSHHISVISEGTTHVGVLKEFI